MRVCVQQLPSSPLLQRALLSIIGLLDCWSGRCSGIPSSSASDPGALAPLAPCAHWTGVFYKAAHGALAAI